MAACLVYCVSRILFRMAACHVYCVSRILFRMAACLVYCVSHILFGMSLAIDVHCATYSVRLALSIKFANV